MIYRPSPQEMRERTKEVINARNWGVGLITSLISALFFFNELERVLTLRFDLMSISYLAALATIGVLIFLWIWATQKELNLLFDWLDPEDYEPPSTIRETAIILFLGIFLGGLVLVARSPFYFCLLFMAYSMAGIPIWAYLKKELVMAITNSGSRLQKDKNEFTDQRHLEIYEKALSTLNNYYLERPMMLRSVLGAVLSVIAFLVSVYWKFTASRPAGAVAYILVWGDIASAEVVIGYWRLVRDDSFRRLSAQLHELKRK